MIILIKLWIILPYNRMFHRCIFVDLVFYRHEGMSICIIIPSNDRQPGLAPRRQPRQLALVLPPAGEGCRTGILIPLANGIQRHTVDIWPGAPCISHDANSPADSSTRPSPCHEQMPCRHWGRNLWNLLESQWKIPKIGKIIFRLQKYRIFITQIIKRI